MQPCALCRREFRHHLTIIAHSKVRWRGNSFDAYQAQGKLGLAVARALGIDPLKREEFDRFVSEVSIRDFREKGTLPVGKFDPAEGEVWEFHIGFLQPRDEATVEKAGRAALEAVRSIPSYDEVFLDKGTPRPQ